MEALANEPLDVPEGFNSDDEIEESNAQSVRLNKLVRN